MLFRRPMGSRERLVVNVEKRPALTAADIKDVQVSASGGHK